jgi:hypothetical protein
VTSRRFPTPWTAEEQPACFVVRDHNGQALAYVYYEDKPSPLPELSPGQLEHSLGKREVVSSILTGSTINFQQIETFWCKHPLVPRSSTANKACFPTLKWGNFGGSLFDTCSESLPSSRRFLSII